MKKLKPKWNYIYGGIAIIVLLGLLGLFIYIGVEVRNENRLLNQYGKHDTATIIKIYSGYRSKKYVWYQFAVEDSQYEGNKRYHINSHGHVAIGDKFIVLYYPTDPTINKLQFDRKIE